MAVVAMDATIGVVPKARLGGGCAMSKLHFRRAPVYVQMNR